MSLASSSLLCLMTGCPLIGVVGGTDPDAGPSAEPDVGPSAEPDAGPERDASFDYVDGDEGLSAIRGVFEEVCERLHSDCRENCDDLWVYCGETIADCVEQYTRRYTEDLLDPVVSPGLAGMCAEDVAGRSCQDLEPETYACERALLDGCSQEDDAYERNYAPHVAAEIDALPATLTLTGCEEVSSFFEVDLGDLSDLVVERQEGEGDLRVLVYRERDGADWRYEELGYGHLYGDTESVSIDVSGGGKVVVEIEPQRTLLEPIQLNLRGGYGEVSLSSALDRIWEQACTRLHSDCEAHCEGPAAYCGESVTACRDAFVETFWEGYDLDDNVSGDDLEQCATALENLGCSELDPRDVPSCTPFIENVVRETCALDPLGWMRPVGALQSAPLALPATQDLPLCDFRFVRGMRFEVELLAGESVTASRGVASDNDLEIELFADAGAAEWEFVGRTFIRGSNLSSTLPAAPVGGTYQVQLSINGAFEVVELSLTSP